jgi:hypothetical protein
MWLINVFWSGYFKKNRYNVQTCPTGKDKQRWSLAQEKRLVSIIVRVSVAEQFSTLLSEIPAITSSLDPREVDWRLSILYS